MRKVPSSFPIPTLNKLVLITALVLVQGGSHAASVAAPAAPQASASARDSSQPERSSAESDQLPWRAHGNEQVALALQLLRSARDHGIDPEHYKLAELERRFAQPGSAAAAAFDRELTAAMRQFIADLHFGRTKAVYRQAGTPGAGFDPLQHLTTALAEKQLPTAIDAAAPAIPIYARVKTTLAQYRELARLNPQWEHLPAPARGVKLVAGSPYPGAARLQARLQLLGDIEPGQEAPDGAAGDIYTPALLAGVRHFQSRHGLEEDGVPGPGTMAALDVPPSSRVQQLELTLERLRWLPAQRKGRMVVVNLPAYRLWAFDTSSDVPAPPLEMRVIVGTGARTPTPLFIGQMRYLEFNPYWNVPRSIERAEIIPKLERNASYLEQNDMEVVSHSGQKIADHAAAQLSALKAGTARVRQRPGSKNVLGAVKFAMPNPMNIYLHSTSAKELFKRNRRDLSHGCIRVEQPAELAQFVLADPVRWSAAHVADAMLPAPTSTVQLKEPVPVVLFYATAITGRDGTVSFTNDIYRQDQQLIEAMKVR